MIEETAQAADLIRQIDLMILRDGGLCQQLTVVCLMVMEEAAFTVKTSHQGGCPIDLQETKRLREQYEKQKLRELTKPKKHRCKSSPTPVTFFFTHVFTLGAGGH